MIVDNQTNFLYLADTLPKNYPDFYKRFEKVLTDSNIKGETIFYGKAIIPIDMLVKGCLETYQENPGHDIIYIVDYMFDYYCT